MNESFGIGIGHVLEGDFHPAVAEIGGVGAAGVFVGEELEAEVAELSDFELIGAVAKVGFGGPDPGAIGRGTQFDG